MIRSWLLPVVLLGMTASTARAEPIATGTFTYGAALGRLDGDGDAATRRVATHIAVVVPVRPRLSLGVDVSGGLEAFWSGVACGRNTGGQVVAAVGLVCFQTTVGAHALAAFRDDLSPRAFVAIEAGPGLTYAWLSQGTERTLWSGALWSALGRISVMARVGGKTPDGHYALGASADALGLASSGHVAASGGIVFGCCF